MQYGLIEFKARSIQDFFAFFAYSRLQGYLAIAEDRH